VRGSWARVARDVVLGVTMLAAGCASRGAPAAKKPAGAPGESLQSYITKMRELAVKAKPIPRAANLPRGSDAPPDASTEERVGAHRTAAEGYRRAGDLGAAYGHFSAAVSLDRRDAASHDGLARVWRDWGFPALGVADAQRALFYAPESAAAHNTLGTLLFALGRHNEAQRAFTKAVALQPEAPYAWSNLCYVSFRQSQLAEAAAQCRHAIGLDPELRPARNNLGLVYAATGNTKAADEQFAAAGDEASRQFNRGIVLSAGKQYAEAAGAFDMAAKLRPAWALASTRAQQARRLAAGSAEHGTLAP
jgi:tetratricopeptide (TPR) repeat protein